MELRGKKTADRHRPRSAASTLKARAAVWSQLMQESVLVRARGPGHDARQACARCGDAERASQACRQRVPCSNAQAFRMRLSSRPTTATDIAGGARSPQPTPKPKSQQASACWFGQPGVDQATRSTETQRTWSSATPAMKAFLPAGGSGGGRVGQRCHRPAHALHSPWRCSRASPRRSIGRPVPLAEACTATVLRARRAAIAR